MIHQVPVPSAGCECHKDAAALLEERFVADHAHHDEMLDDVAQLAECGSFVTAAKRWGELRLSEERHMNLEDDLIASLERLLGPTIALKRVKASHADARAILEEVAQSLSRWDLAAFRASSPRLSRVLREHRHYEEEVLLPELKAFVHQRDVRDDLLQCVLRD